MARPTKIPTPRFNLRNHHPEKDKDNPTLIVLVLRYNGKRLVWSTQEKARPRFWDKKRNRVKVTVNNHFDADINNSLNDIATKAIEIFKELGNEVSTDEFKQELNYRTGRKKRPEQETNHLELFPFIESYLEKRIQAQNAKRGTWKILKTCANHLKNYAIEKHNGSFTYEDVTWDLRHDFEDWLYQVPRQLSTNYTAKMLSIFKQFMNEARERDYHTNEIYRRKGWNIKKEKLSKVVLSFEELNQLYNLDLSNNKRLERVRDLFLIGAYSGLRFSDFTRIKPEHVVKEDGADLLVLFTKKTNTEVVIPLFPILKELLEKYNYQSPKKISNQKFNQYIKEVCELAGITETIRVKKSVGGKRVDEEIQKFKLISAHTARRSFATNFYQLGFPAIELMGITGHSLERQFMEYINIDKRTNAKNMAARISKMMGKSPLRVAK